jgi:hypothetical protein
MAPTAKEGVPEPGSPTAATGPITSHPEPPARKPLQGQYVRVAGESICHVRHRRSEGRRYYDDKLAPGRTADRNRLTQRGIDRAQLLDMRIGLSAGGGQPPANRLR